MRRHITPSRRAGIASFAITGLALAFLIRIPASVGWVMTGSAFYAAALLLGVIQGVLFGRGCAVAVGLGAFLAAAAFSVPVVLVTYGLALAGLPLVVAFAAVAGAGAAFGSRFVRDSGAA